MRQIKLDRLFSAGFMALALAILAVAPSKATDGIELNRSQLSDVSAAAGALLVPTVSRPVNANTVRDAAPAAQKQCTVMVFLNAKYTLSQFADPFVSALEKVGSTANMNVVVEEGKKGQGSTRLFIEKSKGDVVASYASSDMGDYKHVIDFMQWAKTNYPAKHYMLVIWNHGGGWLDPVPQAYFPSKSISIDEDAKDYIRTPQLGEILRQAGPVDVLNFYACLMQMAEVSYEVKDYAGAVVGSEETMAAGQYYYDGVLSYIDAHPDAAPADIGSVIVSAWQDYMNSIPDLAQVPGTMSTLDTKALADLPAKVDAFSGAVMNANDTDAVTYALQNVIRFESVDGNAGDATYGDLYDFASLLSSQSKDATVQSSAKDLMDYISGKLVLSNVGVHVDENGQDYSRCHGISINLPMKTSADEAKINKILETKYSDLAFGKASHWADFTAWADKAWIASQQQ